MQVAVSNWEAERLSAAQISYAARDVLLTYHTHRQLRQWQAAGAQAPACQQCQRRLGMVGGICLVSMLHISPGATNSHAAWLHLGAGFCCLCTLCCLGAQPGL